ncbi:MAG: LicD family protein [Clostridia bacterium]|nr:LicD family protein [Clostridia bacterium]
MKKITLDESKKIQLGILVKFAEFCDKHNLWYCLAYGSLIGAIRHKGFIPWDDDIDLVMMRKDYDFVIENFNREMSDSNIVAIVPGQLIHPYLKIGDKNTVKNEEGAKKNTDMINIDVFPLDGIPEGDNEYEAWKQKLAKIYTAHYYQNLYYKDKPLINKFKIVIKKILLGCYFKNRSYFLKKAKTEHEKYPYDTARYVGSHECLYSYKKERILKGNYVERIKAEFEGLEFYIPKNYHEILTAIYGDYMQLPPEEQRVTHHLCEFFIKD